MSHALDLSAAEARAYLAALQEAVEGCADDDDLAARICGLAGGAERVLHFLASGMASSFRPERAAGASGLVQFVVATADGVIDLWLEFDADGCRTLRRGVDPDTVVTIALAVFLRIAFRQLTAVDAYIDGRVEATGDVVLAASLDDWFDLPALEASA
jgi:hypothetical protein